MRSSPLLLGPSGDGRDENRPREGMKVGVLKLVTIWPFADKEVKAVLSKVKGVVVPEMNLGQVAAPRLDALQ